MNQTSSDSSEPVFSEVVNMSYQYDDLKPENTFVIQKGYGGGGGSGYGHSGHSGYGGGGGYGGGS